MNHPVNYFQILPNETICNILGNLQGKDWSSADLTCSLFHNILNHDDLLRVQKYPFLMESSPEGSLKEKTLWVINKMKILEDLVKGGMRHIASGWLQAHEVFIYFDKGQFKIMAPIRRSRDDIIAVADSDTIHDAPHRSEDSWLLLILSSSQKKDVIKTESRNTTKKIFKTKWNETNGVEQAEFRE